jgi:biopolymer transport protein TolR
MAFLGGTDPDEDLVADINVTPLVDVMLVLLVVFMITAPMLHQGIEVALPQVDAQSLPMRVEDPLVVSVNKDGIVYLMDRPVHPTQLVEQLQPLLESRGEKWVLLKGDKEVAYGSVMEVMDVLRKGGITNVGMVTEAPPPATRRRGR